MNRFFHLVEAPADKAYCNWLCLNFTQIAKLAGDKSSIFFYFFVSNLNLPNSWTPALGSPILADIINREIEHDTRPNTNPNGLSFSI